MERELPEVKTPDYIVYTDGGCDQNPGGTGGYAAVIIRTETGEKQEINGSYYPTTNNRMELMALIKAIETIRGDIPISSDTLPADKTDIPLIAGSPRTTIRVYSDSRYVIHIAEGKWNGEKNQDLWERYRGLIKDIDLEFRWVAGHDGTEDNERCDFLATQAILSISPEEDVWYKDAYGERKPKVKRYSNALGRKLKIPKKLKKDTREITESYLRENGVNKKCADEILKFRDSRSRTFRDYMNLKTYGVDWWSYLKEEELKGKIGEDVWKVLEKNLEEKKDILSAAKWYGRGLRLSEAIRKVSVGREVEELMRTKEEEKE